MNEVTVPINCTTCKYYNSYDHTCKQQIIGYKMPCSLHRLKIQLLKERYFPMWYCKEILNEKANLSMSLVENSREELVKKINEYIQLGYEPQGTIQNIKSSATEKYPGWEVFRGVKGYKEYHYHYSQDMRISEEKYKNICFLFVSKRFQEGISFSGIFVSPSAVEKHILKLESYDAQGSGQNINVFNRQIITQAIERNQPTVSLDQVWVPTSEEVSVPKIYPAYLIIQDGQIIFNHNFKIIQNNQVVFNNYYKGDGGE